MKKESIGIIKPVDKEHLEIEILAKTLYGEARGEGLIGLEAVANTIMNRVKVAKEKGGKFWWGGDVISVCTKPYQFSCWNKKDPNREKLEKLNSKDKIFAACLRIARKAVAGILKDNTEGSTHYHTKAIEPFWAKNQIPDAEIGEHLFYKLV
jgi:N-acetylmuramoyl-L-alanine amidase